MERRGSAAHGDGDPPGPSTGHATVDPSRTRPAGMCAGPGHVIVYGNPALVASLGMTAVGIPAREALVGMPREGFALLDAVYRAGRPLARWIRRDGEDWRLTVAPRVDVETGAVYGVSFHLRARTDVPILARRHEAH